MDCNNRPRPKYRQQPRTPLNDKKKCVYKHNVFYKEPFSIQFLFQKCIYVYNPLFEAIILVCSECSRHKKRSLAPSIR